MSLFKEIRGATINYGVGKFIPQIIGFLLIPLYTIYLTPTDYGLVEISTSFAVFAMVFMRMAIPGSVARFYYEHKEGEELRDYLTTVYRFLMFLSISMALIILLISYLVLYKVIPELPIWPFVILTLITGILNTNSEIQKRLLQARKQSKYSAVLSIVTALIGIISALIFVVVFKMGAVGLILAGLVGSIIFFVQAQFYLKNDLGGRFSWDLLKPSFKYSLNIVPSHMVTPLSNLVSRSLLAGLVSMSAVGIYSLAFRFISPLYLLAEAFNSSYIPIYIELRKKNDPESYKKLKVACIKIWMVTLLIYLIVTMSIPALVYLLTPDRFHEASNLIPYLSIGFLFSVLNVIVAPELFYTKQSYWISVRAIARAIINIGLTIALIPALGVYAIVISHIAEGAVILFFSIFVSRKEFNFDPGYVIIIKSAIVAIIIAACHLFMIQKYFNYLTQLIFSLFFLLIFVIINIKLKFLDLSHFKKLKLIS